MTEKKQTKPVDNLEMWNRLEQTNPAHTKHVGQRGGFTAIDAMYQVKTATAEWGPIGKGWGFDYDLTFTNEFVVADVTLWYGNKDQYVRQCGQKNLKSGNRADEDAVKKAVTDGLTKCLSYTGMNADVFLGMFDDNKYVAEVTAKFKKLEPVPDAKETDAHARCLDGLSKAKMPSDITVLLEREKDWFTVGSKKYASLTNELTLAYTEHNKRVQPSQQVA